MPQTSPQTAPEHIHFVTGRLAAPALERVLAALAPEAGFSYSVDVLNITVAALMAPQWIAERIQVADGADRVLVPGYVSGSLDPIAARAGLPVERGPRDLRQLPKFFHQAAAPSEYGPYNIEIIAEINHCPQLPLAEILREAERLRADGADLIDVGCDPGNPWTQVGQTVTALRREGHRVSIDSLNPAEIQPAMDAGAELVLSVNSQNRHAAAEWNSEVVAIPDNPADLSSLDETIAYLTDAGVRFRIDPVLEPIGFGFAHSLGRYLDVRRRYPKAQMMMGVGNLTELTDVDSAGINVLLLGFCAELDIHSVLTTQVINWARTSVRECDLARRLVHYAVTQRCLPKHVEPRLVMLRDEDLWYDSDAELDHLAAGIRDNNYRLSLGEDGRLHLVAAGKHLSDADPFQLFEKLARSGAKNLDPDHAFYLGYEACKAAIARTLGKQYEQDEALDWGLLTVPEKRHRLGHRRKQKSDDTTPSE